MTAMYDLALSEIGGAHRKAASLPNFADQKANKLLELEQKAKERGKLAMFLAKRVARRNQFQSVIPHLLRQKAVEEANLQAKLVNSVASMKSLKTEGNKAKNEKKK